QAAAEFDVKAYQDQHPFPSCFTCGPARAEDEGLRLFPGRTSRDLLVAWPWQPQESLAGPAGTLDPRYVWAALDCPSGLCWYHDPTYETAPHVLGQLTARIRRLPTAGERLVAAGWLRSADGRKRHSGSAIWADDGEALAPAEVTWVRPSAEQFDQFRAARSLAAPAGTARTARAESPSTRAPGGGAARRIAEHTAREERRHLEGTAAPLVL